jgi:hypothetical protein
MRARRPRLTRDVLAPAWRRWLVDNLARGVAPADLRRILCDRGVPRAEADRGLRDATRVAAVVRDEVAWSRRLERVLQLRRAHRPADIERRALPGVDEFHARYWATSTPAIFTDLVPRWPAFTRWTLDHLRDHYGDVEILAEFDRAADPDCDINHDDHRAATTMAAFLDRILAAGDTGDVYAIANNRNLARPGLRPLLADTWFPPGLIDEPRLHLGSALWLGPAGTVTSLHHDTSNILFCQILGRKRVRLVAPDELAPLRHTRGVYSRLDPERPGPEWADTKIHDLTLAPGDALFIPAGWWHHVRALDPSTASDTSRA